MNLRTILRKAVMTGSLARGGKIKLGHRVYEVKRLFPNPIALQSTHWDAREEWLDAAFKSVLQCRAGVFVDVGANLGQTMFKILALDPSRQYVGFEPQIGCCLMLQSFLEENHIGNFTILPVGLSNTNQFLKIHGGGTYYGSCASVVEGFRPDSFYDSLRYVCLRKGDEALADLNVSAVCGIKVDVEGAELEVFEGLLHTIERTMPFLIFEVLNHSLAATGTRLSDEIIRFRELRIEKLEKLLRELGYEIFNLLPGNRLTNIRKIAPAISKDLSLTNYIAVSKPDLEVFLRVYPKEELNQAA
jgi:FkbM family methyltransferase